MSLLDDPEEKLQKKRRKCAKNAAYAIGGAIGLWVLKTIWPEKEGAEKITEIFAGLGWCLLAYGLVVLATMMFKREWALHVNALMTWLIVPGWVAVLLIRAAGGL